MAVYKLSPPNYELDATDTSRFLFLAGPIQGAPDWQAQATQVAMNTWGDQPKDLYVASPRRRVLSRATFDDEEYGLQVDWEQAYIDRATKTGAVIFWFAAQDLGVEYKQGRAYAQTTRIEIGESLKEKAYNTKLKLFIGFEPGYNGGSERYIRHRAKRQNLPVYDSLEEITTRATSSLLDAG